MKIVVKEVGKCAEVKEVEKLDLSDMQRLVGGLIQPVYMDDIIIWCNDEGKLYGLDVNIVLADKELSKAYDTLNGNIFFTNEEEGNEGLSAQQVQFILEKVNNGAITFTQNHHIIPVLGIY